MLEERQSQYKSIDLLCYKALSNSNRDCTLFDLSIGELVVFWKGICFQCLQILRTLMYENWRKRSMHLEKNYCVPSGNS